MQTIRRKYQFQSFTTRVKLLFICLSLATLAHAQVRDWPDSVKELNYQVDTTLFGDTAGTAATEDEYEATEPEDTARDAFFLRKEFTGGFPDTLRFRKLPNEVIKALKDDKDFWYADEIFKKQRTRREDSGFSDSPAFQTFLWLIIVCGFIAFLVIYLANSSTSLFRKSRSITSRESDPETSDIFNINYQAEIDQAAAQQNFRLAVRLMFLRLLRDLSTTGLIQYRQDGTNFDYMMQLQSTPVYPDFFRLARHYEYSWYGQFAIDKEKYIQIKDSFDNLEQRLNK